MNEWMNNIIQTYGVIWVPVQPSVVMGGSQRPLHSWNDSTSHSFTHWGKQYVFLLSTSSYVHITKTTLTAVECSGTSRECEIAWEHWICEEQFCEVLYSLIIWNLLSSALLSLSSMLYSLIIWNLLSCALLSLSDMLFSLIIWNPLSCALWVALFPYYMKPSDQLKTLSESWNDRCNCSNLYPVYRLRKVFDMRIRTCWQVNAVAKDTSEEADESNDSNGETHFVYDWTVVGWTHVECDYGVNDRIRNSEPKQEECAGQVNSLNVINLCLLK